MNLPFGNLCSIDEALSLPVRKNIYGEVRLPCLIINSTYIYMRTSDSFGNKPFLRLRCYNKYT
ncbi:MAG: hypothetical protein A2W17_00560 [Planctomycetes bacterium RBG_16_41_13]|nr:MAG: hypothetical protein A2W17_00560 [Planctomycetes bacterium RBG_16_41_13]